MLKRKIKLYRLNTILSSLNTNIIKEIEIKCVKVTDNICSVFEITIGSVVYEVGYNCSYTINLEEFNTAVFRLLRKPKLKIILK